MSNAWFCLSIPSHSAFPVCLPGCGLAVCSSDPLQRCMRPDSFLELRKMYVPVVTVLKRFKFQLQPNSYLCTAVLLCISIKEMKMCFTERRGLVINTSASYSGCSGFRSRLGDPLTDRGFRLL
jgi:hypothetical protein